jgi:hypothetical protein
MRQTQIQSRLTVLLCSGLVAIGLAGCASSPPVQEMFDARQAIQAAEDAGAATHAPRDLRDAKVFISNAEQKLEKRAYNGARNDAREAHKRAISALNASRLLSGDNP